MRSQLREGIEVGLRVDALEKDHALRHAAEGDRDRLGAPRPAREIDAGDGRKAVLGTWGVA